LLVTCLVGPGIALGANAKPAAEKPPAPKPLTLIAPTAKGPLTIALERQKDGSSSGELSVAVRSRVDGELVATYHPGGAGSEAGAVSLPSPAKLEKGQVTDAALTFTMPKDATPEELNGTVVLQDKGKDGSILEIGVVGSAPTLAGVAVQPETVTIKLDSGGPFGNPDHTSTPIHLAGPGVPGLFAKGASPSFSLLLHSSGNDTAQATLTDLKQSARDPQLATATLEVDGDLGPGSFEGSAPISSGSPDSPKLTVAVESGNSFVWALLVVFIGAVLGGGLYLASNRKRRKNLLRDRVKALLSIYADKMATFPTDEDGKPVVPVWSIASYLGTDETRWYKIKTNAIVDFDGAVQTIWSAIHWARNDEDLDAAAGKVDELETKIVRWITAANAVVKLEEASEQAPTAPKVGTKDWTKLRAPHDTTELLAAVQAIEPIDDEAIKSTIERMQRQAHWHVALAATWNALMVIEKAMEVPGVYSEGDVNLIQGIDLAQIDSDGSPESSRDAAKQVHLELEIAETVRQIRATYKGAAADLEPNWERPERKEGQDKVPLLVTAVMQPLDLEQAKPDTTDATRAEPSTLRALADKVRGPSATDHKGNAISPAVNEILRRDLAWTIATALASAAVYVPTIFNSTWGTVPDYVGALAAGFVGKAAISWAGLPFFESLSARAAAASPDPAAKTTTTPT
jgi:hypothetical protein